MISAAVLVVALAATPGVRRVGLTATGCGGAFVTEVRQLLAIELKATVGALFDSAPETVALECSASIISVEVLRHGEAPAPLTIDVSSVDEGARARTVALLLAEVMSAAPPPPPVVARPAPSASPEPSVAPVLPDAPARLLVTAGFTARTLEQVQLGGTVGVAVPLLRWFGVHAEVSALTAQVVRPGGRVQATAIDGAIGVDLRWSPELVMLRLGPGLRCGWGLLEGRPDASRVGGKVSGVMWGPQVSAGVSVRPRGSALVLNGSVDLGWWLPRLTGSVFEGTPVVVGGPFGVLTLGVGWLP
ncbi:MAG: hypothetical protein JNM69_04955 [Archangium sp.]|nr:hypothetical protein [Archangium sp.]